MSTTYMQPDCDRPPHRNSPSPAFLERTGMHFRSGAHAGQKRTSASDPIRSASRFCPRVHSLPRSLGARFAHRLLSATPYGKS